MPAKRVITTEEITARLPAVPKTKRGPRTIKPIDPDALLVSRAQVCRMLGGVHKTTVIRLEKAGKLQPKKLSDDPSGTVYYRREQVMALIAG